AGSVVVQQEDAEPRYEGGPPTDQLHKGSASTMSVTYTAVLPVRDETVGFLAGAADRGTGAAGYPCPDPGIVLAGSGGAGAAVVPGRHPDEPAGPGQRHQQVHRLRLSAR